MVNLDIYLIGVLSGLLCGFILFLLYKTLKGDLNIQNHINKHQDAFFNVSGILISFGLYLIWSEIPTYKYPVISSFLGLFILYFFFRVLLSIFKSFRGFWASSSRREKLLISIMLFFASIVLVPLFLFMLAVGLETYETVNRRGEGEKYSCSVDRDCSDFGSQAEAQKFFDSCGFTKTNDPMDLDGLDFVDNGVVCEEGSK